MLKKWKMKDQIVQSLNSNRSKEKDFIFTAKQQAEIRKRKLIRIEGLTPSNINKKNPDCS